jgi:hypothetical protein
MKASLAIRLALVSFLLTRGVEGRLQNVYTQHGATDVKSIQSVPVSFGIVF